jgi:hypothetical protein
MHSRFGQGIRLVLIWAFKALADAGDGDGLLIAI